jgi:ATP-dependent DNA ligase
MNRARSSVALMPSKLRVTTLPQKPAAYIEPMDCLAVTKLPNSANWVWEIKIDGYRAIAVKSDDRVNLYSRTKNSFNNKFSYIVDALSDMPAGTVLDGELVAIDNDGRPNFNLLQNFRTGARHIQYYVFDVLCLNNRDTTRLSLIERRNLLKTVSFKDQRIKILDYVEAEPAEGRASDVVVGQTLRYMSFVQEMLAEKDQTVQGIIIALEDDQRIRRALAMVSSVRFFRYQVTFRLIGT